jgi:hypothetical protein
MVIVNEKVQPIVEMAQFKGFGIIIEVRSDDHGKFGNKQLPAHAHILDNSKKELAQIELTKERPSKETEIVWYKTPNPPVGLGAKIVKLAESESRTAKQAGVKLTVWQNVLNLWFVFHES